MHASILSLVVCSLTIPVAAQSTAEQDAPRSLDAWRARFGARWVAHTDAVTGRAEWIYGGVAQWPGLPRTDDEWVQRARVAISAASALHGVDVGTLIEGRVQLLPLGQVGSGDKWSVELRQEIAGLSVHGGTVNVLFDAHGALLSIQSHALTDLDGLAVEPLYAQADARERAVQAFTKEHAAGVTSVVEAGLVVLPIDEPGRRAGRLAWEVDVQSAAEGAEPVGRRYWIDARTGVPLRDEESVHFFDITGTVSTLATPGTQADSATNPETSQPAKYLRIQHAGGVVHTDVAGNFTIPGAAPAQNVTLSYVGLYGDVDDAPTSTRYAQSVSLVPGPGNAVLLNPGAVDTVTAQANIFNHVATVRDYVRRVTPTDSTADRVFVGHANINSTCNAYYNGSSINFYAAGGSCNNTAFSTVVAHEQGHWLNDLYGTSNGSDGMGEGNADVFALYVFDTPLNGQGFFTSGGSVRSGLNTRQFCGDCSPGCYGEVHSDGEVWMGAAWKVRANLNTALGNTAGDLVADQLFMGWMNGFDQREIRSVIELQWLLLDDDDANLANGTPHGVSIQNGFRVQGFPGYFIEFTNIDTVPEATCERSSYPVTADVAAVQGTTITAVTLSYRVGAGAFVDVPMTPTGGNSWRGDIPYVSSPATVEYTVRALDSAGHVKTGTCGPRSFFIGQVVAFATDGFESASGWTHGTVGDTSNTNDDWQRGVPQGESGDPAAAAEGTACWGNDLGITATGAGNGAYQANVHNFLSSPVFDCSGQSNVNLIFERWLTVEKSQYDIARILVNGTEVWRNPFGADLLDTSWTMQSLDISGLADGNPAVTIRFELQSDGGLQYGGWQIDHLRLGRVAAAPPCNPGVSFCAGDGSATACPCANASPAGSGRGCLNSLGTGGLLVASGTASLASDSVVLSGTSMPNSSALYFQGTAQQSAGLGVAFGDGLRCAAGSVIRLGTKFNAGGASQYPVVGDPPVSVRGLVVGAGTRTYQGWYRNAAAFCTVSTFNLTNGVSVTWTP
ncbi:MAG: hypothetical protein NTY35_04620 [Planctomycetota bacterium]|nr:hypothetical protein [Planctomycetota bacterium]